jgi:hypothetical protein
MGESELKDRLIKDPESQSEGRGNPECSEWCFDNIGWILCAVGAAICYSLFNCITAEFIYDDIWSSKVLNSMVMGLAASIITARKRCSAKTEEAGDFSRAVDPAKE